MSAAQKFTFDLDLARKPPVNKVLPEDEFDRLIAAAREEGYVKGWREGQQSQTAQAAQTLAQAADDLATRATALMAAIDAYERDHRDEAITLAAQIGRKLAAHLIARQPVAELEALISDCLSSLENTPHLAIRCHPDLCDALRATTEQRMALSGFAGRLVVIGDPDIGIGDGRIEWADGGLVRDINAISSQIDTRIFAFLAARGKRQGD